MIASPPGGGLLGGVIGGRMIFEARVEHEVNARSPGGVLLGEIIGAKEKKQAKSGKKTFPEERCVDSWEVSGQGGVWRWQHWTPPLPHCNIPCVLLKTKCLGN